MNVGMIGVGAMGSAMAGHIRARSDHTVVVHDVDAAQLAAVAVDGVVAAGSLAELAACAELAIVMVSTDDQVREVVDELLEHGRPGLLIVVASTNSPGMMEALDVAVRAGGMRIIDAPVVFGLQGPGRVGW